MFQFKQFAVDQSGCAMKINTDGVLLGALATAEAPQRILDIGTGTGVIALMLAQRFTDARIDAVEIDEIAAATAGRNFKSSAFDSRLKSCYKGYEAYLQDNPGALFELIVSNPPFYIHSLKSPEAARRIAKHTDELFFESLIANCYNHLSSSGLLWLILPVTTALVVQEIAQKQQLHIHTEIAVRSYPQSDPHRFIIAFSKFPVSIKNSNFIIYDSPKQYTDQYSKTLKDFFTIF